MSYRLIGRCAAAVALSAAASLASAPSVASASPTESGPEPDIAVVGSVDRVPQEAVDAFGSAVTLFGSVPPETGTFVPVPGVDQVWQVYPIFAGPPRTGILVREAHSLRVIRSFVVGDWLRRGAVAEGGGEWLHAHDDGRRVWLVGSSAVFEVDARTFVLRTMPPVVSEAERIAGLRLGGLSYDPVDDDVLALLGGPVNVSQANALTVLRRIDLATGQVASRPLRSCTGPLPSVADSHSYGVPVLATEANFVVPCGRRIQHDFGTRILTGIVRVPRVSAFDPLGEEAHVEWPVAMEAALVDPPSGRIVLLDVRGELSVWAGDDLAFVDVPRPFDPGDAWTALGLDGVTGDVIAWSREGVVAFDVRVMPRWPELRERPDLRSRAHERIVALPGRRALALPGRGWGKAPAYTVLDLDP